MSYYCKLENRIDHGNVDDKYRNAILNCALLEQKTAGMSQMGTCCAHCCLRISDTLNERATTILRGDLTKETLENDPNTLFEYLPQRLHDYYQVILGSGKKIKEIERTCGSCKSVAKDDRYNE